MITVPNIVVYVEWKLVCGIILDICIVCIKWRVSQTNHFVPLPVISVFLFI